MIINNRQFDVDIIRKNISPVFSKSEGSTSFLEIALLAHDEKDLRRKLAQFRLELEKFEASITGLEDEMMYVIKDVTATQIDEIKENNMCGGVYTSLILDFRVKDIYDDITHTIQIEKDNIKISNPGLVTPVTIRGEALGGNFYLLGLDEEFSMKLDRGDIFEVNSYDKIIKVNGSNAYEKMTSWYFPRLKAGESSIGLSGAKNVEIEYRRRWA